MKLILLAAIILLTVSCASEQEEIQANQRKHCKEEIMAGKQPTEFCLSVLPEYRNVVPAQQMTMAPIPQEQVQVQPQPQQMYAPQAAPVVVQAPAHQDSTLQNMLLGGVIGHAIGSSNSQPAVAPAPQYVAPRYAAPRYVQPSRNSITKNITINQAPVVATKPPVKSYMDMSKLSSYGARPSTSPSRRK